MLERTPFKYLDFVRGAKLGVLMTGIMFFQTLGLETITASLSAFLTGFSIVFVLMIKLIVQRQLPQFADIAVSLICLIGLGLVTQSNGLVLEAGVLYTLACALILAFYINAVSEYVVEGSILVLTLMQLVVVALLVVPFAFLLDGNIQVPVEPITWKSILFCASFCSCAAFGLQVYCQRYLTAFKIAMLLMLEPVFATIFSYVALGEVPYPTFYAGACMILGSIAFMNVRLEHI